MTEDKAHPSEDRFANLRRQAEDLINKQTKEGRTLTALKINLQTVQRSKNNNSPDLAESIVMVEQTLQQVRAISRNLPPTVLEDLGLAPQIEIACFRVGQEAAYARARQGSSLGMISMQERVILAGGHMEIESVQGQGTTIHASFPLEQTNPASGRQEKLP
jgi:signal transduction histidine kinase